MLLMLVLVLLMLLVLLLLSYSYWQFQAGSPSTANFTVDNIVCKRISLASAGPSLLLVKEHAHACLGQRKHGQDSAGLLCMWAGGWVCVCACVVCAGEREREKERKKERKRERDKRGRERDSVCVCVCVCIFFYLEKAFSIAQQQRATQPQSKQYLIVNSIVPDGECAVQTHFHQAVSLLPISALQQVLLSASKKPIKRGKKCVCVCVCVWVMESKAENHLQRRIETHTAALTASR